MAKSKRGPLTAEEKRPLNKDNFKKLFRIFSYVFAYKYTFLAGLFFLVISSLTLLAFPYVAGKLVDAASGKGDWIIRGIDNIALGLLAILLVQSIFSFFRVYLFAQVSERAMADIRLSLYRKLMSLPIAFFDRNRTGELISRITSDVSLLQNTFSATLAEFFRQITTLTIGVLVLFYITPELSIFMLATFPVIILIAMLFGNFIRKLSKQTQDELARANVIVEETLQSINTVKAFTGELFEVRRYGGSLGKVVKTALRTASFRGAFISFVIFALFGGIVGVIWYGASLVQAGSMTIGGLISFVFITTFIGGSIAGLGDLYGQLQRAIGASERVLDIIRKDGEIVLGKGARPNIRLQGMIAYHEVAFSYPSRKDIAVLKKVSFQVPPGAKIALVGPSGAGKSTIVQLLMRFYEVGSGSIHVDGKNIKDYDLISYRKQLGIVPQEVLLFGGSIKENIAYGKPGASLSEIKEAAEKANALQFIDAFPDGFDTIVGERGIKLSGGQRQRIAIARAILKDPAILILDEATSSLDAEAEYLVQSALDELMKGRTTIIIAHRLATIRKVDKIYVVNEGKIVEEGMHQELLEKEEGTYSNLVKLQLQED